MAQNYYQVLGLTQKAKAEDIQPAYRKLAADLYPGVNRGEEAATARMMEINRAYEVLKNPAKRSEYDLTLNPSGARPSARPTQRPNPGGTTTQVPSGGGFGDVITGMLTQAGANLKGEQAAARPASGATGTNVDIWLTPREAVDGVVKQIRVDGKLIRLNIRIRR